MGIFKSIRKSRKKKKRAAKSSASLGSVKKSSAKESQGTSLLSPAQNKLLSKQERRLNKANSKGLKRKNKHEQKLAKTELAKRKAGRFNKKNVLRISSAARAAAPLLLPLIYRAVTAIREQLQQRNYRASVSQLALTEGNMDPMGVHLLRRSADIKDLLKISSLNAGFVAQMNSRLDELIIAIQSAESMTPTERSGAYQSLTAELNELTTEIQNKIND